MQASAPGRIVLDRLPVSSHYDAATGLVSFDARQPLVAGIHIVEVVGADGTLAASHATFRVMPPLSLQPPRTPAGTVAGQARVGTSTPDGSLRVADAKQLEDGGTRWHGPVGGAPRGGLRAGK